MVARHFGRSYSDFYYRQTLYREGSPMNRKSNYISAVVASAFVIGLYFLIQPDRMTAASAADFSSANVPQDSKTFDQKQALADLKKQIAGKENQPSGEVFKNIQMLKAVPAGRLLAIMQIGYSKSLGVDCTHCHVPGEWEKEDKPTKQITRDMAKMSNTINSDLLKNIKNLKGPNSVVNCTTCHRGQIKPALDMPN